MKILILILINLFLSINSFSMWMSADDVANCGNDGYKYSSYLRKIYCDKNHIDCINIFKGHNCKTDSNLDTQVDDPDSPKATKSQMETCIDEFDCQAKLVLLICIDPLETSIKNLDLMQVYCSKPNGFNQMTVKRVREDAAKKAIYDSLSDAELTKRNSRNTSRAQIRALISSLKTGTDLTLAQRRKLDLLIIRELIDE